MKYRPEFNVSNVPMDKEKMEKVGLGVLGLVAFWAGVLVWIFTGQWEFAISVMTIIPLICVVGITLITKYPEGDDE